VKKLINYTLNDFEKFTHRVNTELKILDEIISTMKYALSILNVEYALINHTEIEDVSKSFEIHDKVVFYQPYYLYKHHYFITFTKDKNIYFIELDYVFFTLVYQEYDKSTGVLTNESTSLGYMIYYSMFNLLNKPSSLILFNTSEKSIRFAHILEFTKSNIHDELAFKQLKLTFEKDVEKPNIVESLKKIIRSTLLGVVKKFRKLKLAADRRTEYLKECECHMKFEIEVELIDANFLPIFKTYVEILKKKNLLNKCLIDRKVFEQYLLPHLLHSFL